MATIDKDTTVLSDEDHAMQSTHAMRSIEQTNGHNNHNATVNPSKVFFNTTSPDLLSPRLPFHALGSSSNASPTRTPLHVQDHLGHPSLRGSPQPRPSGISPPTDPDAMDVSMPAQSATVQVRVAPPPKFKPLPYPSKRTGLVYDDRMKFHAEPGDIEALIDDIHPEDPRRIYEIFHEILEAGLVQESIDSDDEDAHEDRDALEGKCWRIHIRHATKAEICLVHTPEHYDFVESLQEKPAVELKQLSYDLDSIYFNNATYDSALLAAGGAIEACRAVVQGQVRNAIAIIRPPGHHAESDAPSGFCIFNNVPIAARVCQANFPEVCRKILILDWDVHHGNGIQNAFYDDPNVLYISLHVFRGGSFYPGRPDADLVYCGEGPGLGRNVNIPWEKHGMGDAEYIYAFQQVVMPVATEFDPDLVIISAGFDAAEGDTLGGCHVTPAGYAHMTHMLLRIAQGKMAVCLEGGYNLRSIARSALAVTRTLMLQPPDRLADDLEPNLSCVRTIEQVKRQQSKFWKCFYPKQLDPTNLTFHATKRLHEVLRTYQSQNLAVKHRMSPLPIHRNGIAETFEHNVIATPDFQDKHPLLVIFHDPPTLTTYPDPYTGKTELHNMWLTDTVDKEYIGWAIENGFQVIDVNIPRVISIEDDDGSYIPVHDNEHRNQQIKELAAYIWENYIEPHQATQVFFMGIGSAYTGLVDLLGNNEACTDNDSIVECLVGFVADTSVQSIKRAYGDDIADWYYKHARIYVQPNHTVWDPTRTRKLRKKWGKLIRSEKTTLDDMLAHHMEEVQQLLLQKKHDDEGQSDDKTRPTDSQQHGQGSLPLPMSEMQTPRQGSVPISRNGEGHGMPPIGLYTIGANSPRSPSSPLRQDSRRG
ncbi:Histone deacetylase hda1 [Kalmusia sp. IMI 367209]|nr:Histone deacetylase hda1 [Kalmusia sp. IMI 367209]